LNIEKLDKKIGVLDWLIFISIVIMFIMVYVPQSIWAEEEAFKKERRNRMKVISQAEEFYYELTGSYTTDYNELFFLVEAAMDSLIADSLFTGRKTINLNNKVYEILLESGFEVIVDTTFSKVERLKKNVVDTLYTVIMNNDKTSQLDTIVTNSNNITKYKQDSLFVNVLQVKYEQRSEIESNYLRRKFHLNEKLIYCPISNTNKNKKFILEVDKSKDDSQIFKITSPVSDGDSERRYGIFKYSPGQSESIIGGKKSWAEK